MGLLTPAVARTAASPDSLGSISVVESLEHALHPWTSYVIVPLFGLANTGVTLSNGLISAAIRSPITWGIIVARVIGKPLGILLATRSVVGARLADWPANADNRQFVGVATSAGMGFTVALFIAELAFDDPTQRANATLGILAAAMTAAVLSLTMLICRARE